MKEKLSGEVKDIFTQSLKWLNLEIRYIKLSAAEKLTILMASIFLMFLALLIGMVILILLAWALVDYLQYFMSPPLACLTASGALVLLVLIVVLLRRPLVFNPIARFISKLIIDKE